MSEPADPGPVSPTIQSLARAGRQRFGGGWEAGKRVAFFGLLVLIMLVPLGMVAGVIEERAATKAQVVEEIGAQWGPAQVISGPALVVPYEVSRVQVSADGQPRNIIETRYAVFTPEELHINARSGVQKRYKSIYEMLVYGAEIGISGRFAAPNFAALGVTPSQINWGAASLVVGLSGVRAVNAASLEAAGGARQIEAGVLPYHPFENGIRATLPLDGPGAGPRGFDFDFKLALNGRDLLSFQPLGRQSEITIASDWPHPNFTGSPLPARREIGAEGFSASWSISHIATGSPLSWLTHEAAPARGRQADRGGSAAHRAGEDGPR